MYIIVVGGGKVGYHLARALLTEGHEILVIEKDRSRKDFITNELGGICMHGDGCEAAILTEAGTGRADMLIAVTGEDEDNLVSCQLAKHKFNVPRTIARSSNPKNEILFHKLGIDVTVSSTNVIMEYIQQEVPTHVLTHLLSIPENGMELVDVRIPPDSLSVGKRIKDIKLPNGSVVALIIRREEKPLLASPETTIQIGDQIIAVTPSNLEEQLKVALRGS